MQHPIYRWFWIGQFLLLIGIWMMDTTRNWLAYELTNDPFKLGLLAFASNAPVLVMGLFTGRIVDSCNRQRLLSLMQFLTGCIGFILFLLSFLPDEQGQPMLRYWHLLLLAFIAGIIILFDMPARLSLVAQMVPRHDLPNALALNSMVFNLTRIVGPSLAGIIATFSFVVLGYPMSGGSLCFLINAVLFFAVSLQTISFKLPPQEKVPLQEGVWKHMYEGLKYCWHAPHIGIVILYVGVIAMFGLPYLIVLPVFVRDVFGGDTALFGRLLAFVGLGALLGGMFMARVQSIETVMRIINRGSYGFALSSLIFAHFGKVGGHLYVAYASIFCAGLMMVFCMIGCQTLVQTLVSERFRGRINSFYMFCTTGFMPIGGLLIGMWASWFGPDIALTINAVIIAVVATCYRHYRPRLWRRAMQTSEYQQLLTDANL